MFGLLGSLAKAAVGVVVAPVALAVDIVTLPASASELHRGPFDRTAKVLDSIGENIKDAVEP